MTDTPRRPDERKTPRLRELATLPVFFKLGGKRVVLAGGSDSAAWKAELISATGAHLDVFAPEPGVALLALAADVPTIRIHRRAWVPGDLPGAALAIGDAENVNEAEAFSDAAKAAGVPVNVVDSPEWCDFQFGAIVERSPLVVAISTDGAAPVFGQELRTRIETLMPDGMRHWARAAKAWRPAVMALKLGFRERRNFWEQFTKLAFANPDRQPTDDDRADLLKTISVEKSSEKKIGSVALVGAGPGDPELLTLKAVRVLQSADVVLFDDLVSPQTVNLARREATRITVGKRGYKPSCTQEEITSMLLSLAREGKRVVRLKGGDPMIFGRANEELSELRAAGISVEVVPGVTTASAAAASLGQSLTERDVARRLQFITAHARDGKLPTDLDWRALADPRATTVVYMGLGTFPLLSARLVAEGLPASTPAVMVERATWPDEMQTRSTIGELAAAIMAERPKGPAVILIGEAFRSLPTTPSAREG